MNIYLNKFKINRPILTLINCILWISFSFHSVAQSSSLEYQVKTSFIYNFLLFTEWPHVNSSIEQDIFLNLCIVGKGAYGTALDALNNQKIGSKIIKLKSLSDSSNISSICHAIIFSSFSNDKAITVLKRISDSSVLTIGETDGFLEIGGQIQFVIINDSIKFEINQKAVETVGLTISSKVLRLANRVILNE